MTAEQHFMVKCDAPRCERIVADDNGVTLFHSLEHALATAEKADWLVEHERNGTQKTYCPNHWHTVFRTKQPWWGAQSRRRWA